MPKNKNAMTRYQILDELLSNRYHNYSIGDLTDEVNRRLAEMDEEPVTRRCIELDIQYLEIESPFMVELERYSEAAYSVEKQKNYKKRCLRYADPSFSIFKKKMTSDEEHLLSEARERLLPLIESNDKVVLDFEGVSVVSNSFADECLAKLFLVMPFEELKRRTIFASVNDFARCNIAIAFRRRMAQA